MRKIEKELLVFGFILLTACTPIKPDNGNEIRPEAVQFKTEYEALNNVATVNDVIYRELSIDEDNPMVEISPADVLKKIEEGETFYVYFGDEMCPWCRAVLDSALKAAKEANIETIYYVEIWDEEHSEVLRDTLALDEEGTVITKKEGTDEYFALLAKMDNVLSDYRLTNKEGEKVETGEKRIYAPNYVYFESGKAIELTGGTDKEITDPWTEISDAAKQESYEIFTKFFSR